MPLVDYRAAVIKRLVFVRSTLSQGHENHRMVPKPRRPPKSGHPWPLENRPEVGGHFQKRPVA
jgi:hypothetical protein